MKPAILLIHASGTNRDGEAARACTLAGGAPEIVHINQLRRNERRMADYAALIIPGGFTYGDALGAGTRMALDLQIYLADALQEFVASGKPVLGICNGFQVLVKAGLLGIPDSPTRQVTLTKNAADKFECRWVHLSVNPYAKAGFLGQIDDLIFCPVANGEGNFQVQDDATLAQLENDNLVAFRYVDSTGAPAAGRYPLNPSGSVGDIAGICNAAGNVVGLMPHPEDHVVPIQNPLGGDGQLGLALFQAMIGSL